MAAHLPPVPPANRSDKGPGETDHAGKDAGRGSSAHPGHAPGNTREQDRQGNIEQNTHNPGYQQDR